jgi:hypothetical protein
MICLLNLSKPTIIWHVGSICQKNIDLKPLKSHKIPGLPIRSFLENPAKCPDLIQAIFKFKTLKRAHYGFFKTGILCPEKYRHIKVVWEKKR